MISSEINVYALELPSGTGIRQDFHLDTVGNVDSVAERLSVPTPVTRTYTYDGLDRLTAQKNGSTTIEGFAYDATGNRTSKTVGSSTTAYGYGATNHRLASVGSAARTYDNNGNTTLLGPNNNATTFTYDDRNRLREVRVKNKLKASYRYNGLGQRVLKTDAVTPANSRQYVYDSAGHLLGEYTLAGVAVKEYVWLDDTLVAILSNFDGSTYQYVETDHLGTPRAVVHPAENTILWRWDLTPTAFGEHLPNGNPDGDAFTYTLNLRYPGQYFDAESGLHYNYFRDYEPATGRYILSDPIGLSGGSSTYSYVGGNPFASIDPQGLLGTGMGPTYENFLEAQSHKLPRYWRPMGNGMYSFVHPDPMSLANREPFLNPEGEIQCVELVKQGFKDPLLNNTSAKYGWRKGPKVDQNTPIGTAMANRWVGDRYPSNASNNHAALHLGWSPFEIRVLDQYNGKSVISERMMPTNLGPGAPAYRDGGDMHVILWERR